MYIFLSIIVLLIFIIGYIFINIKYKKLKKELTKYEIHSIPLNDYSFIAYFLAIISSPLIIISIIMAIKNNMIGYWCCLGLFLFIQILCIIVNLISQLYTEAFHKDKLYVFRIFENKIFPIDKIFYIRDVGLEGYCYDINFKKLCTLYIDDFKRKEIIKKVNHHHPILIITTGLNNYNNLDELFNRLDDKNKTRFLKIGQYLRKNKDKTIKKVKKIIHLTFVIISIFCIIISIIFNLLYLFFILLILLIWLLVYNTLIPQYESRYTYNDFDLGIIFFDKYNFKDKYINLNEA